MGIVLHYSRLLAVVFFMAHNAIGKGSLDILVSQHGWDGADLENIELLLQSAADQFTSHFKQTSLPPVYIFNRTESPIILHERSEHSRVQIGLATGGTYWAQYAFQFSHEFIHLLIRHMDTVSADKDIKPAATWLEESLCEVGSLFALRRMALKWKNFAPYPNWTTYSGALFSYAQSRIEEAQEILRDEKSFEEWFMKREVLLKVNATNRKANLVVATQMLPYFEQVPQLWEAIPYYPYTEINEQDAVFVKFAKWCNACPKHLRAHVKWLATVFY